MLTLNFPRPMFAIGAPICDATQLYEAVGRQENEESKRPRKKSVATVATARISGGGERCGERGKANLFGR